MLPHNDTTGSSTQLVLDKTSRRSFTKNRTKLETPERRIEATGEALQETQVDMHAVGGETRLLLSSQTAKNRLLDRYKELRHLNQKSH